MPTMMWPSTLPQRVLVDGYTERPPANLIRSQPQKGPAIVRKYTSAAVRPIQATVMVELWQLIVLDDFFTDTLDYGLWPFWFPHPRQDETPIGTLDGQSLTTLDGTPIVIGSKVIVRLVEPPTYTPNGPVVFQAAMNLEVLP